MTSINDWPLSVKLLSKESGSARASSTAILSCLAKFNVFFLYFIPFTELRYSVFKTRRSSEPMIIENMPKKMNDSDFNTNVQMIPIAIINKDMMMLQMERVLMKFLSIIVKMLCFTTFCKMYWCKAWFIICDIIERVCPLPLSVRIVRHDKMA